MVDHLFTVAKYPVSNGLLYVLPLSRMSHIQSQFYFTNLPSKREEFLQICKKRAFLRACHAMSWCQRRGALRKDQAAPALDSTNQCSSFLSFSLTAGRRSSDCQVGPTHKLRLPPLAPGWELGTPSFVYIHGCRVAEDDEQGTTKSMEESLLAERGWWQPTTGRSGAL